MERQTKALEDKIQTVEESFEEVKKKMLFRNRKAQSTLEYILVLTAIVGVIIWAAATLVKPKVEQAFTDVQASIESTADEVAP